MTPVTDIASPDAVDRNAANAPPASMAVSIWPVRPSTKVSGNRSTMVSEPTPSGRVGYATLPSAA